MSSSPTTVLITGANSGIGFATAQVLVSASQTYHVILASRSLEKAQSGVEQIRSAGDVRGQLSAIQLDVTDPVSISAAAEKIATEFGSLDVLINNAGVAEPDPAAGYSQTVIQNILMTNVAGPTLVAQAFNNLLLKSEKNPYSLFISSGLGSLAMAADPANRVYPVAYDVYRMSKAALDMLVVQQSKHLKDKGVKVFAVCPGLVRSHLRGKTETDISASGAAGDPKVSGQTIRDIIEGRRDADVGKFVHKDGVYPW
ncbi:putative short chain dehydrogenase/reductase [Dactylonectria estremocensis]|uniref:Short chain dehydrogenase/reductase n=1 Tax=Dactylonectria estremocensis TaxID=1079267 RepID=A0A9P9J6U7_9HYPO|nr:putative short chain dehydrogenase/reductase [Dactylonectria estremocensis]